MALFEKFGELGSADEINELAQNLLKEGDTDSIRILAKENGIPADYADMFITGDIPFVCDIQTAAVGKIEVEADDMKAADIMEDWAEYIKAVCIEDEKVAASVRSKGKSFKGCVGKILEWAFSHQQPVDSEILKAAGVRANRCTLGMPGQATARKLIKKYYGGSK